MPDATCRRPPRTDASDLRAFTEALEPDLAMPLHAGQRVELLPRPGPAGTATISDVPDRHLTAQAAVAGWLGLSAVGARGR